MHNNSNNLFHNRKKLLPWNAENRQTFQEEHLFCAKLTQKLVVAANICTQLNVQSEKQRELKKLNWKQQNKFPIGQILLKSLLEKN